MPWAQPALSANPTGGTTAAGNITITPNGRTLTIQQQGQRAIINWQDFSIGAGELTRFIQPDAASAVLNRVVSGNPSTILGHLEANGRIFLLNPNGILVGAGARIDTAGFLASTLNVRDDDFLRGGDLLFRGGSTAAVQNLGTINALGGDVFLIARRVENQGTLIAANGTAGLGAGSEVLLTTGGSERVFVQAASASGTLLNAGQISATTAELKATGGNAYALAIDNRGVVRATGTAVRDGQVWLVATGGAVASSGSLAATNGDRGGEVRVLGEQVALTRGASIDVSGAHGGGTILVGGDYQGKNPAIANAQTTTAIAGVTLKADAIASGNGGRIVVWSDEHTAFAGSISARGGADGGDGGFAEVSGHRLLDFTGKVDLRAPNGIWGTLLLDPRNVTISSGATGSGALGGGSFTPSADNSILNVTDLQNALASSSVTVTTGSTGSQAGDITVANAVTWSSGSTLTLSAYRDIAVNAAITGSGAGNLVLRADSTGTGTGTITFGASGSVALSGSGRTDLYYNPSSYAAPTDYSGKVSGAKTAWMLVNNVTQLQNVGTNLAGTYAQGRDIDASATSGWNSGAGFVPIGTSASPFSGSFDGNGHTITGLFINRPATDYVGLFGSTTNSPSFANLQNVSLVNVSITASNYTGGLTGASYGNIASSSVTGSVSGVQYVGGLTGYDSGGGAVTNSRSAATVSGTTSVGGLIGSKVFGTIAGSSSTGTVTASTGSAGGLVGSASSTAVSNSYSTGSVTGKQATGGLIGTNNATAIANCYNTGSVSAGTSTTVGGLIGRNAGATSSITASYNTGAVSAGAFTGGLVGEHASAASITNSYSTGSVNGGAGTQVGGLVGRNYNGGSTVGAISFCYSTGAVTSSGSNVGGLVGFNSGSTVTNSFWDTQTSGKATSSGGGTGMTTAQMQSQANFTSATAANGNANPGWNFTSIWRVYDGYTYPLLKAYLTPLTVTASAATRTYDGTAYSGGNGATYSTTPTAALLGTLSYGGTSQGARNAGTYTLVPTGLYSAQQGYDLTPVNATLTVNKAALTITAAATTKTYDGIAAAAAVPTSTALGTGDTLTGLAEVFDSPNAGARTLSVSAYTLNDGNAGNNYTVTTQTAAGTINPAALTYTANAASRTYGAANPAFSGTVTGFVNGETQAAVTTGTAAFGSPATTASNVGSYAINGSGLTLNNGNYTLTQAAGNAAALTINPAALTITAGNAAKTYGQLKTFVGTEFTAGGLQNGETVGTVTLTSAGAANTAGVAASPYVIVPSAATGGTFSAGNYTIGYVSGALTVNPAPLTIVADSAARAYGVANPSFTATYTGLVNGETSSVVSGLALGTAAALNSPVGSYAITAAGASAANYTISYVPGVLAVGQNLLTISADNKAKTYGAPLPAFTASYAGFVNGDNPSVVTGLQFSTTATLGSNAGTYVITPFGGAAADYAIAYVPGTLTVNPAALTIRANDASRFYGAVNPAFTASYTGLVNGDTSAAVTGLQFSTTATAGANVGTYALNPFGGLAANYTLTYVPGALSVNPAALTITADSLRRDFGRANPPLTATYAGLVNGDAASIVTGLMLGTAATASSPAGRYAITASGATAANYAITFVDGVLAVGQNLLTITADNQSKVYGAALPAFTASYAGFVNGDSASVVTGLQFSTAATAGANVGTYVITPFGASAASYAIAYVPGTLTINPAALTLLANDASRLHGADNPGFTASYSGLVNGDASSVVTGLQFNTAATVGSPAGAYAITPFGATAANYTITFLPGTLTVTAPFVTVNGTPALVMLVAHRPMLTGTFAAAEFAGRWMLVPAGRVRLGESLDAVLAGTLGRSGRRSTFMESGADRARSGRSPRSVGIDWREELVALHKLTGRALVLSSSYDTLPPGEGRVDGFFLPGLSQ